MMKNRVVTAVGFMWVQCVLAQAVPMPFEVVGGRPVPAHHVRLEGSGASQRLLSILKTHQEACARLGKPVELPSDGMPVSRVTRDDYYTPTHLIEFKREELLNINADCAVFWQSQAPKITVISPQGACTLYMKKKVALGMCRPTPSAPLTTLPTLQQEVLGRDNARNCVRTATLSTGVRSVQCVELPPESWRSFLYRAGADRRGIVLESVTTIAPNDDVIENIKAVEVRKNITVGSDMHDLAHSQGFQINPGMEPRR